MVQLLFYENAYNSYCTMYITIGSYVTKKKKMLSSSALLWETEHLLALESSDAGHMASL